MALISRRMALDGTCRGRRSYTVRPPCTMSPYRCDMRSIRAVSWQCWALLPPCWDPSPTSHFLQSISISHDPNNITYMTHVIAICMNRTSTTIRRRSWPQPGAPSTVAATVSKGAAAASTPPARRGPDCGGPSCSGGRLSGAFTAAPQRPSCRRRGDAQWFVRQRRRCRHRRIPNTFAAQRH